MRHPSNYPNRKHTPDTLRIELEHARRAGSATEVADLALLIQNVERPKGSSILPGVTQARNRQGARRYLRERTQGQTSSGNPERRHPKVGDYVRVPDGQVWLVTDVRADTIRSDGQPGCVGVRACPTKLVTIVDEQAPTAPGVEEEALYHAAWDALESQSWEGLEQALRAYEARLAS